MNLFPLRRPLYVDKWFLGGKLQPHIIGNAAVVLHCVTKEFKFTEKVIFFPTAFYGDIMRFILALLAVKDIEVSKKFYCDVFDQTVTLDLGRNVTFSGGFAVQQDFAWLTGIDENDIVNKPKNMELYFETEDFAAFIEKIKKYNISFVHKEKKYEWKQRVIRIYDPDGHIIEVGESMEMIAKRYLADGYSVEETAEIIMHPVEFVQRFA